MNVKLSMDVSSDILQPIATVRGFFESVEILNIEKQAVKNLTNFDHCGPMYIRLHEQEKPIVAKDPLKVLLERN